MKIIENSEMFTQIVNSYKHEKKHCGTNMILMQNQIDDRINSSKLYYDLIEGVLWFFEKNEDYYTAYFYLPKEERLRLTPQDLDIIVGIIGNQNRYNTQWETELLESGFEKYNKNLEFLTKKEQYQDLIEKQKEKINSFVERMGCYCRSAKKEDYDAMYQMWRSKIDKYAIPTMTDKEIEEMEKYNRGLLILNEKNEILATISYSREGNKAVGLHGVSLNTGLGGFMLPSIIASAFQEGCDRFVGWIWENNTDSLMNARWFSDKTGKFCQQFLMRKAN